MKKRKHKENLFKLEEKPRKTVKKAKNRWVWNRFGMKKSVGSLMP